MNSMKPFGLAIQSEIRLPGCHATGELPDVTVRYGGVPDLLPDAVMTRVCTQIRPGRFLLRLDGVAKYLVEEGSRITIEPAPGATDDEIRLFLMAAVWSALLLQRGLLPLHGSAVQVQNGAVILAGPSGNGKSTLAAALAEQGYPVLADELCALSVSADSLPLLLPGFPQMLLWEDALRKLGRNTQHLTPVRPGLAKWIVPLEECPDCEAIPLRSVYLLTVGNTADFDVRRFTGMKPVQALIDATYRVHHVAGHGLSVPHFNQCANAARNITVKRVERPATPFDLAGLVSLLREEL